MVLSMDRWVGKTAVVTGASSGMGASIADLLVEHGLKYARFAPMSPLPDCSKMVSATGMQDDNAQVVGMARRSERIEERAKELSGKKGKLYAVKADMTKEDDILEAFEWTTKNVGPVAILINNAGICVRADLTDASAKTEDWKTMCDVNVIGVCIATREAVKIMRANNIDGHIVHIGGLSGHAVPINTTGIGFSVYPATKHAVKALTEMLRQELNKLGTKIKISEISPGLTATEMTTLHPNLTEECRKIWFREHAALLQPEDVADGVVYVLSTPQHVQVHNLMIKPFPMHH